MKKQEIKHLTDIEHVLLRPGMYIGSTTLSKQTVYITKDNKFVEEEIEFVPGLVKLFNELIDNSVDEFVRTKGEYANKIDIDITSNEFSIQDNGRGIPVTEIETHKGMFWSPTLAWTELKAGSNFEDKDSTTIGTNGVGSSLCSIFSKEFIGISNDGNLKCTVRCENNNDVVTTKVGKPTGKQGVHVKIIPDVQRFGLKSITEPHISMIKQRLYNLSVSYPGITFKLNGNRIKLNAKKFLNMFGDNGTIIEHDNFSIAVFHSDSDDFKQFSLMNGLNLSSGGNHMNYISDGIVRVLRDKIIKKYKTIKPADIKRKLFIVCIMKNFKGPKYETQTKEYLSNPMKDIREYFSDLDLEKFADRIYRNKAITDSIIDYFRIAEEFKKKQELKGLNKTKKKIKSEKYTRAVGKPKMLFIAEGDSAANSVAKIIGRDGNAFYALKGKPLNAYSSSQSKFTSNKELTELYQIIQSENWEKIVITSDSDLDGFAINGLLFGFFFRYLDSYLKENKIYRLNTPVAISKKGKKITDWVYDFDKIADLSGDVKYLKGLGSLTTEILETVIAKDGFDNMLMQFQYTEDSEESIDDWYSGDKADKRKTMVQNNNFSIIKL